MRKKLSEQSPLIKITTDDLTLAGIDSPKDLFSCLAHLPWAIWLDSCDSDHMDSRYDIMAWHPVVTLQTNGEQTQIQDLTHGQNRTSVEDPLQLLKCEQEKIFSCYQLEANALPFNGGTLGYFGYDLGRSFEKLPSIADRDLGLPEMAVGIYTQAVVYDNKNKEFFLICPEHERQETQDWLAKQISVESSTEPFSLAGDWQANMDKSAYGDRFNQVHEYLLSGDCYQINLAQRFTSEYQGDEFSAYLALRAENNAPFSAFIRLEDAAILSVSPERFLQLKDGLVQSKPIKGTRPRGKTAEQDRAQALALANADKDRAENLMIVDLLRNDISKVCQPGSVLVPKLFDIESFPAVHHLVSTVEGKLSPEFDGTDLLRGAFPGGSITGAPKIRAMEIIEELEPHRRSVYCGSIGYLSACGSMDTSISIRTLICEQGRIYCWAGGGLVADSDLDSEYQETFDKVEKILPILKDM